MTPYDACTYIDNSSFIRKAIFMRFSSSPSCPLQVMLKNLNLNDASLAIIGLSGRLVSLFNYRLIFKI